MAFIYIIHPAHGPAVKRVAEAPYIAAAERESGKVSFHHSVAAAEAAAGKFGIVHHPIAPVEAAPAPAPKIFAFIVEVEGKPEVIKIEAASKKAAAAEAAAKHGVAIPCG